MKKLAALALFALVALISVPLAATEAPAAPVETPAIATPATPAVSAAHAVADALPFAPVNLATCQQLCASEYSSCKLDCRFQPYPGCANDCWMAYQACLAGC
jgi:hypothetical protein